MQPTYHSPTFSSYTFIEIFYKVLNVMKFRMYFFQVLELCIKKKMAPTFVLSQDFTFNRMQSLKIVKILF